MARRADITEGWYIGSDLTLRIAVTDGVAVTGFPYGSPQTMTGWSLHFEVRVKRTGGQGTLVLEVDTPTITLDDDGGTDNVAVIPVPISAWDADAVLDERTTYEHALYRTDGETTLLAWGDVRLIAAAQN